MINGMRVCVCLYFDRKEKKKKTKLVSSNETTDMFKRNSGEEEKKQTSKLYRKKEIHSSGSISSMHTHTHTQRIKSSEIEQNFSKKNPNLTQREGGKRFWSSRL